ncbi:hypothetical protein SBP28_001564 [Candidozyma auris]|nr:hypothetical protein CJJ09_001593 [[Candida] auris]
MEEVDSVLIDNVKSFGAGGFGGVCAVLTGHPFDLVKVRLQTGVYKSTAECLKGTLAKDGALGFYRGVLPPLLGVTPMFAVSFWGYDLGKKIVGSYTGKKAEEFTVGQTSAAGFISAVPTTLVAAPFERVKVMMQVADGKKSSMGAVIAEIDGPGSALYFATYEILKEKLSTPGKDLSLGAISIAGGFAGVAMWLGVFPIDTIKSTQQSSNVSISIATATKQIYAKGGIKGFFPGVGPALARSFPANAATFVGVEVAKNFFEKL